MPMPVPAQDVQVHLKPASLAFDPDRCVGICLLLACRKEQALSVTSPTADAGRGGALAAPRVADGPRPARFKLHNVEDAVVGKSLPLTRDLRRSGGERLLRTWVG